MGNNPSKSGSQGGAQSPAHARSGSRREPRRRDSFQALGGSNKATAAHPSESITSAGGSLSSRSQPLKTHLQEHLHNSTSPEQSYRSNNDRMGGSNSRELSRETTKEESKESRPEVQEKAEERPRASTPEPSEPMKVPSAGSERGREAASETEDPPMEYSTGHPPNSYYMPAAQIRGPPRLPLPIEEELHTPGSPVITPADVQESSGGPLEYSDVDEGLEGLVRNHSQASGTTIDDDDVGDELSGFAGDPGAQQAKVPTHIEWRQGGERVYVTGTFAAWERKYRLHRE